ncbi:hypothetical protein HOG16_01260 [Candidatus Woesearchaeota archaeon]|jgi:hypothetical protein|nr:hypothetical protein [Candidatus Woesearchaeota archaeon]
MIFKNKRGQIESADIVAIMLIFVILIFYSIYAFTGSLNTGEIESVVKADNKVKNYNYYPDVVNFLNTEVMLDDEDILISDLIKNYMSSGENKELVEGEVQGFLDEITYCYNVDGKLKKRGFVFGLSNGDKWSNMNSVQQMKLFTWYNGFFVTPFIFDGPVIYQRLNEEDYVYFYVEDDIQIGGDWGCP